MRLLSNHDSMLDQPKLWNATYLSPHIHYEIIEVIGYKTIQCKIVGEVNDALNPYDHGG